MILFRDSPAGKLVTVKDCALLIEYFDVDVDGALSFREFLHILLPCDDKYLRAATTQKSPENGTFELNYAVEKEMVELLDR